VPGDLSPLTVVLGGCGGMSGNEVRAIPVVVRNDRLALANALRRELVFNGWRHALAFCDAAGIDVVNREPADELAAAEDLPKLAGPCPTCGGTPEVAHG
jgi:hypothetical protein